MLKSLDDILLTESMNVILTNINDSAILNHHHNYCRNDSRMTNNSPNNVL